MGEIVGGKDAPVCTGPLVSGKIVAEGGQYVWGPFCMEENCREIVGDGG